MFDVGFWELLFIMTLALLVLGPAKLPGVVSTAGRWLGRARVLARGLRTQIERELEAASAPVSPTSETRGERKQEDPDDAGESDR